LLNLTDLKNLLHKKGLSQTDALLLMIAANGPVPKRPEAITKLGLSAGLRNIRNWNVSARLAASNGKAINTPHGWELTDAGRKHIVNELGIELGVSPMSRAASGLAKHSSKIRNPQIREFVEEAIECLDHGHRRAAVVLSWVGAVAILQEYVVSNRLVDFNAEAARRNTKWKTATTADDISSRMEEFEFLQTCSGISLFGKSVKNRLEQALKLRNGAGHPNQLALGELEDAAHVESLVKNVFEKFVI
jgi:hypothetical protein